MSVPDLLVVHNAISPELESNLVAEIDYYGSFHGWNTTLKRRTLHFGYTYEYKSKNVSPANPMPPLISQALEWFITSGYLPARQPGFKDPYQCIVNEYTQTQGITAHTDANIFGANIVSLSLNADTSMRFTDSGNPGNVVDVFLPRCSVVLMKGLSRYQWEHAIIPSRKTYPDSMGRTITKPDNYRRLSLTFRYLA